MEQAAPFNGVLEVVLVAIPFAVLLTLVALFLRGRKPQLRTADHLAAKTVYPAAAPLTPALSVPINAREAPALEIPAQEMPAPEAIESADAVAAKIESAMANGEKLSLATLYLQLAAAHGREQNIEARMSALRSAAGNGSLHGPHAAHAAARLALGEAAQEAGDLTSACEQWQLARTAFLEGGDTDQHARIEKRMRDNGCPTDWVLTDF